MRQTPRGWIIHVEGGGTQPFAGQTFTRYQFARRVLNAWLAEKE